MKRHGRPVLYGLTLLICLMAGCGPASKTGTDEAVDKELSAEELIRRMIAAYSDATTYTDRGTISLRYKVAGKPKEDTVDLAVTFERPNKIAIRAYQATVACDGERLRAKIADESTNDFDGQVVERAAPEEIEPTDLYAEGRHTDPILVAALTGGLGGLPVQLELLLGDDPLATVLNEATETKLLPPKEIDGHKCRRVELQTSAGQLILWIDDRSFALRRMQYPVDRLAAEMNVEGDVTDVSLVAELADARLKGKSPDDAFQFAMPSSAKRVPFFRDRPLKLPSELFGAKPKDFAFTNLAGEKLSQADLLDKTTVLVWFQNHPSSQESLSQLQKVYEQSKDDQRIAMYAVCVEPSTSMGDRQVRDIVEGWDVSVPVVRDLDAVGRDVFEIIGAPTLVVLDAKGTVQIFEVGANPDLAVQLPQILERLFDGADLASELLARAKREQREYRQYLKSAGTQGATTVVELPQATTAERTEPKLLKMTPLWTCRDLKRPGNILAVEQPGADPRILVLDGTQGVVEMDARGKVVRRHELPLPEDAVINYLRTGTDSSGRRRFVGFGGLAGQLFVFDQEFKLLLAYPEKEQRHDGITDVQIADLDGDGTLELCVGFWGLVGVQAVSLDGRRIWTNRSVSSILSLAVTPPNDDGHRRILVTSDRGQVTPIDHKGQHARAVGIAGHFVNFLFASDGDPEQGGPEQGDTAQAAAFCGLSYTAPNELVAVGIRSDWQSAGTYRLPGAPMQTSVRPVTSGRLLDGSARQWLLTASDSSIHVLGSDFRPIDRFQYGVPVFGLAATRLGTAGALLVSTDDGLTAWKVELPEQEKEE